MSNEQQELTVESGRLILAAEGWMDLGNFNEAIAELDRTTIEVQHHPAVLKARWMIQAKAGRWEDCLRIAEQMVQFAPESLLPRIRVVLSLYRLGQWADAIAVLNTGLFRGAPMDRD
jgi:hypothetical protein